MIGCTRGRESLTVTYSQTGIDGSPLNPSLFIAQLQRLFPKIVIEKFAAVQMIDVQVPTTDGRQLSLTRYTEPEPELQLILNKLKLSLPAQKRPTITAQSAAKPIAL